MPDFISWVKPILKIMRAEEDITDHQTNAMVGEKVKLHLKVLPEMIKSQPVGKWFIEGNIISDWGANKESAKLTPIEDYDKPEIEYAWVDGSFSGDKKNVKYVGQVEGGDVEADTNIIVFKPKIA